MPSSRHTVGFGRARLTYLSSSGRSSERLRTSHKSFCSDQTCQAFNSMPHGAVVNATSAIRRLRSGSLALNAIASCSTSCASLRKITLSSLSSKMSLQQRTALRHAKASHRAGGPGSPTLAPIRPASDCVQDELSVAAVRPFQPRDLDGYQPPGRHSTVNVTRGAIRCGGSLLIADILQMPRSSCTKRGHN